MMQPESLLLSQPRIREFLLRISADQVLLDGAAWNSSLPVDPKMYDLSWKVIPRRLIPQLIVYATSKGLMD